MKKGWIILICAVLCASFTACEEAGGETAGVLSEVSNHISTLLDGETSIFNHIEVHGGDVVTVDLDVYLSQTEAQFLFLEVTEDTEADLHYTYSTDNKDGVRMGRYLEGSDAKTSAELAAKPKEAFQWEWSDEKITLKKGTNVFYLSGDGRNGKLYLEVKAENPDSIGYVGIAPRGAD